MIQVGRNVLEALGTRVPAVQDKDGSLGVVGQVPHAGGKDAAIGSLGQKADPVQTAGGHGDVQPGRKAQRDALSGGITQRVCHQGRTLG